MDMDLDMDSTRLLVSPPKKGNKTTFIMLEVVLGTEEYYYVI